MKTTIKEKMPKIIYFLIMSIVCITFMYYLYNKSNYYQVNDTYNVENWMESDGFLNITQTFSCPSPSLAGFSITFNSNNSSEIISIQLSQSDKIIDTWTINANELSNNGPFYFYLSTPLFNVKKDTFKISVSTTGVSATHISIPINSTNVGKKEKLHSSDVLIPNTRICYNIIGQKMTPKYQYAFILIGFFLVCSLFISLKLKNEKHIILVTFLSLGLCYFIFIPIFQVNDEYGHFIRSYEITQGDLITPKDSSGTGVSHLPNNMYPEKLTPYNSIKYYKIIDSLNVRLDKDSYIDYANPAQCMYAPISYLPQAIGIFFADLFTDSTVIIFYAARLLNYLVSCTLLTIAISIIPYGKRSIILITATPMFMQQMISCSSDTFINALSLFIVAYILSLCEKNINITLKEIIVLSASCLCIALCKVVYLPLCFLVLLIPSTRFKNKKQNIIYKSIILIVSTVLNLTWLIYSTGYLTEIRPGVNSKEQIKYVLTNIPTFIQIIFSTIYEQGIDWINRLIGSNLSWYDIEINKLLILIYLIMIIVDSILISKNDIRLDNRKLIFFGIISILILGLSLSALYVQWTPLRLGIIEGFQGRYLIPIFLMVLLLIKQIPYNQKDNLQILKIELPIIYFININALLTIYLFNIA